MNAHIKQELDDEASGDSSQFELHVSNCNSKQLANSNKKPFNLDIKEERYDDEMVPYMSSEETDEGGGGFRVCETEDTSVHDFDSMFKKVDGDEFSYVECTLCFKKLKQSSIRQHFKTHAGLRPYHCDICGSRFTRKGDVIRHKRVVHKRVKPYTCRKCSKTFSIKSLLITHLQNHDRHIFYECETCGYKFGKREYYENHIRYIHPLPNGVFPQFDREDEAELQLRELEEEENGLENRSCSPSSETINHSDLDEEISNPSKKSRMEEDSLLNGHHENTMPEAVTSSVQLRTVSQAESSNEELASKILDAAVSQSRSTLQSMAAMRPQTIINKEKKLQKYPDAHQSLCEWR